MPKKDFSQFNPTEKFFGAAHEELEPEEQTKETVLSSKKKKTNSDYLRLDIYDYRDYLSTMAGFRCTSVTKYIQSLIDADIEQNKEIYEKLKNM